MMEVRERVAKAIYEQMRRFQYQWGDVWPEWNAAIVDPHSLMVAHVIHCRELADAAIAEMRDMYTTALWFAMIEK